MNNQPLVKGITQLYSRVFNHHAVLQSDINIMKEFDGVIESSEKSAKGLDVQLKQAVDKFSHCEMELPSLSNIRSSLVSAKQICDTVFLQSQTHQQVDYLAKERSSRTKEWQRFMGEMKDRSIELDSKYSKESESVRDYYKAADKRLQSQQVS